MTCKPFSRCRKLQTISICRFVPPSAGLRGYDCTRYGWSSSTKTKTTCDSRVDLYGLTHWRLSQKTTTQTEWLKFRRNTEMSVYVCVSYSICTKLKALPALSNFSAHTHTHTTHTCTTANEWCVWRGTTAIPRDLLCFSKLNPGWVEAENSVYSRVLVASVPVPVQVCASGSGWKTQSLRISRQFT